MIKAQFAPYTLRFKSPSRTSREEMLVKETYFIKIYDENNPDKFGLGECALFRGLSSDDRPGYKDKLKDVCGHIENLTYDSLRYWPSILFGVETAVNDFHNGCKRTIFSGPWSSGAQPMLINGLVWMGSIEQMTQRAAKKIEEGFKCIKFKIGSENFEDEFRMLKAIRKRFSPLELEIRLDANGAYSPQEAAEILRRLTPLNIHSIEQPISAGQYTELSHLCSISNIPIALDEELIGINDPEEKWNLLSTIRPDYIILKPSLCGGFQGASEWQSMAGLLGIKSWVTSALESDIGLNAIAQWCSMTPRDLPQGLGTGELYTNNIGSPIVRQGQYLRYDITKPWNIPELEWQ